MLVKQLIYKYKLSNITIKNLLFLSEKVSRTPSKRNYKFLRQHIYIKKNNFLKTKTYLYKKQIGRTLNGQLVSFYHSNGFKKIYRLIDNLRYERIHCGAIEQFEFNPNNSSFLARVFNNELNYHFYIRAIDGLQIGDKIFTKKIPLKIGDSGLLMNMLLGKQIHNITLKNSNNIARAAGSYASILQKYRNFCLIRFPSKKLYYVPSRSEATIGRIANLQHKLINLGKAGRNRWLGKRPHVRGVAMNPIDHPHGGGQGKTSGGHSTSVSPWGKPTKQIKKKKILNFAKNRKYVTLKAKL
jgi:large subunit ribosomal protein L2